MRGKTKEKRTFETLVKRFGTEGDNRKSLTDFSKNISRAVHIVR